MLTKSEKVQSICNLGLIDRVARGVIAGVMLIIAVLGWETRETWVPAAVMAGLTLASLYPAFTAIMGWDPLYAALGLRSCGDSGRQPCGSFGYQLKALFGRAPQYCDTDAERSLEACHDEAAERPTHPRWAIDRKVHDYPTQAQLRERGDRPEGAGAPAGPRSTRPRRRRA